MPNSTNFTAQFIDGQHNRLIKLREEITGITPDEITVGSGDFCDASQQVLEHEFALQLLAKSSNSLKLIDKALAKIADGGYGICELSGKPIGQERLEALPWAEYTIECQKRLEKESKSKGGGNDGFGESDGAGAAEDED